MSDELLEDEDDVVGAAGVDEVVAGLPKENGEEVEGVDAGGLAADSVEDVSDLVLLDPNPPKPVPLPNGDEEEEEFEGVALD